MSIWHITGGSPLRGQIRVQGSKNAVLPVIAASLLCGADTELLNCPNLSDVDAAMDILRYLGCTAARCGDALCIDTTAPARCDIPRELMHRMRSSVIFLGPLLARFGEAEVSLPGGCELGPRPIDLHLHALRLLGAEIEEGEDSIVCRASHLRGAEISLALPSVGATENLLMAAALADGVTRIENAAKEPEIVDLADFLNLAGAHIVGAGTGTLVIEGVSRLSGVEYTPIADRIEAGTLACAAAITKGSMLLCGVHGEHLRALLFKLREMGLLVQEDARGLCLRGQVRHGADIRTLSYPGFPTDLQAPMMTVACAARGRSVFLETIFENRYMHAISLCRMGADIRTEGRMAVVEGGRPLSGAVVEATDLRAGAALMLAGLIAQGETTLLDEPGHICRGYEGLDEKLRALGADVTIAPLH